MKELSLDKLDGVFDDCQPFKTNMTACAFTKQRSTSDSIKQLVGGILKILPIV